MAVSYWNLLKQGPSRGRKEQLQGACQDPAEPGDPVCQAQPAAGQVLVGGGALVAQEGDGELRPAMKQNMTSANKY